MAIELSTPSFKPREYEGEYIRYTLYGLDSDGDELDDLITSPKKSTVTHTIKDLLPDYRRVYSGMHVTAILYDKNDRMLDSEVVWSTDQDESSGADESVGVPVIAYIREHSYGLGDEDRRIELSGETLFDKLISLEDANAFGSIGPAEGSDAWKKLDTDEIENYKSLQDQARAVKTFKDMGRFLAKRYAPNTGIVCALRQGDDAVWVNPKAGAKLSDQGWNGPDAEWLENAVMVGGRSGKKTETIEYEKGHKNSRGEDAPWVIRGHKGGKILASFPSEDAAKAHLERMKNYAKTSKHEKLFNVKDLEEYAMKGYKAAVSAAWSAAGVKNFKIDFSDGSNKSLNVWPKTLDGNFYDVSWRIMPALERVVQYADDKNGNSTIEREIPFRTEDDIENIFTDEFKELDSVIEDGKPAKTETVPDDYARDNFLKGALDYSEIKDDNGNVVLLKIAKRYEGEPGGDFCLRSYDGETDKGLAMGGIRYVVGRYGELLDMEPAEAIIEIAKE